MSPSPYDHGCWPDDRPSRAEAAADAPQAGQLAALTRAANARRAAMSPDERAAYDASMADPWARPRTTQPDGEDTHHV